MRQVKTGLAMVGRIALGALALAMAAGCSSPVSSGGGETGVAAGIDPLTARQFEADFARLNALGATNDLPSSGTGDFSGAVTVDSLVQGASGTALADLALSVDFANPGGGAITGSATNFRGDANGETFAYDGTLRTGDRFPTTLAVNVEDTEIDGAPTRIRQGQALIPLYGQYDSADPDTEVLLSLTGLFREPGAQSITGGASVSATDGSGARYGTGDWYATRD